MGNELYIVNKELNNKNFIRFAKGIYIYIKKVLSVKDSP